MEELKRGDAYQFLYDPKDCIRIFIRAEVEHNDTLLIKYWEVKEGRMCCFNDIKIHEHGLCSRDYRKI